MNPKLHKVRRFGKVIALAALGFIAAAAVAVASNRIASDSIGLTAHATGLGARLAPAEATSAHPRVASSRSRQTNDSDDSSDSASPSTAASNQQHDREAGDD